MRIEVEGTDVLARGFAIRAARLQPAVELTVVTFAERAAQKMRDRVPIDTGGLLGSIDADDTAQRDASGVYADAGPELFTARFIERGTVKMPPRPFAGPTADELAVPFEAAMEGLTGWL